MFNAWLRGLLSLRIGSCENSPGKKRKKKTSPMQFTRCLSNIALLIVSRISVIIQRLRRTSLSLLWLKSTAHSRSCQYSSIVHHCRSPFYWFLGSQGWRAGLNAQAGKEDCHWAWRPLEVCSFTVRLPEGCPKLSSQEQMMPWPSPLTRLLASGSWRIYQVFSGSVIVLIEFAWT